MVAPNWFIGLPVAPGSWFAPVVRSAPSFLRLFHPEDVHITVAFLGACGEQRARQAWSEAEQQLHRRPAAPLVATLGGLAPMGNPKRPSALSVVLEAGAEPVAELMGSLREAAWRAAGARPDPRPPLPHITVARPPRRASATQRRSAAEWARAHPPIGARITLDEVALLTWAHDRRVRQFRIVARMPLASAAQSATPRSSPAENAE